MNNNIKMNSLTIFRNNLKNINNFHNVKHLLTYSKFNLNDIYKFKVKNMNDDKFYKDYDKYLFYKNNLLDCYFIFWNKNSSSKIHDHSDNGCYYKIIYGNSMTEQRYNKNLELTQLNTLCKDEVNFIDNNIGYHKMLNNEDYCISVHVYSPPEHIMNIYD